MPTTRYTGKRLYLAFGSTVVSTNGRNFEVTHELETADLTAGADDYRVFGATVKNISATLDLLPSTGSAGSVILAALALGGTGTLEWGPVGNGAGNPRWAFDAMITNNSQSNPYDDAAMWNLEFLNIGTSLVYDGRTATY